MTDEKPEPLKPRSKRIYVMWGVAFTVLLGLGLVCWFFVAPVRRVAAKGLGGLSLSVGRPMPGLIGFVSDRDPKVRMSAITTLALLGPDASRAVPDLIKALRDPDEDVRALAPAALGRIGRLAVPALIEATRNPSADVRSGAVEALGATLILGTVTPPLPEVVDALIVALGDEEHTVRLYASAVLGMMAPDSLDSVVQALSDPDATRRQWAAAALARAGRKAGGAVPALVKSLKDKEPAVRWAAVRALDRIGDRRAVESLRAMLKDENEHVRQAAADALKKIKAAQEKKP